MYRHIYIYIYMATSDNFENRKVRNVCGRANSTAVGHSRHCLLCDLAGIVCCATQQTMFVVSHSRR